MLNTLFSSHELDSPNKKTDGIFVVRAPRQPEAWMGGYDNVWQDILKMENHPREATSMGYSGNLSGPEKCFKSLDVLTVLFPESWIRLEKTCPKKTVSLLDVI